MGQELVHPIQMYQFLLLSAANILVNAIPSSADDYAANESKGGIYGENAANLASTEESLPVATSTDSSEPVASNNAGPGYGSDSDCSDKDDSKPVAPTPTPSATAAPTVAPPSYPTQKPPKYSAEPTETSLPDISAGQRGEISALFVFAALLL